jgi:hypothetical protein
MRLGSGRNQAPVRSRSVVGRTPRDPESLCCFKRRGRAVAHLQLPLPVSFFDAQDAIRELQDQHVLASMHNVAGDPATVYRARMRTMSKASAGLRGNTDHNAALPYSRRRMHCCSRSQALSPPVGVASARVAGNVDPRDRRRLRVWGRAARACDRVAGPTSSDRCAEKGEKSGRLTSCCGLTEGEADLCDVCCTARARGELPLRSSPAD